MNRKNAFTAVAVLRKKMGVEMAFIGINAMLVENKLQEVLLYPTIVYGKNIPKGNKRIYS